MYNENNWGCGRLDDRDYQLLLDLYETRNITKAAQRHFLSQPAMTKRIKRIENELGCELMLRNQKGVVFTPAGERIIPFCRKMSQLNTEMCNTVNQSLGVVGGSLNIYASHNFAHYRLPDILYRFYQRYPNVEINVSTGKSRHLYSKLLQDKLCIAILRGDYRWNSSKLLLSSEPMCVITSHSNDHRALTDYPYIGHHSDADVAAKMEQWAETRGLSLRTTMWVDKINGCKELVRKGLGWSILPRICLDDFDGTVEDISFEDGSRFTRSTYIMYWESYAQLQQVRKFLDILEEFRQEYASQF